MARTRPGDVTTTSPGSVQDVRLRAMANSGPRESRSHGPAGNAERLKSGTATNANDARTAAIVHQRRDRYTPTSTGRGAITMNA